MRRNLLLAFALTGAAVLAGCSTTDNTNGRANTNAGNPPREGVVETNANIAPNTNSKTVSSNTGVLTNNNGNKNTAGVNSINGNRNRNRNQR